jgi:hypothetical protein
MKSTIWVYIIIFIFSAIYVFKHDKYTKRIEIINGYCENFSVERGQDLEFYLNAQVNHKKGVVCIYDVNNQITDSLILNLIMQNPSTDTLLYRHGYQYKRKYTYNTSKLKSGIYFLGNVVPFIVKESQLKDAITVVFPLANFMALSNEGGKSFDSGNSSHGIAAEVLSMNRLPYFRNSPFAFVKWIKEAYLHKNINFISDLDLENVSQLNHTKLLILYGYHGFMTLKARRNLDAYLGNGGNLLAICSNLINNKILYDEIKKELIFSIPKNDSNLNSKNAATWNKFFPNTISIGCSYELSYEVKKIKPSMGAYLIINKKHPIFKDIEEDSIKLDTKNGNSIAVLDLSFKSVPEADNKVNDFILNKILAFDYGQFGNKQTVTGIFNFKRTPKSGEIIVIGNEKWCYAENIQNNTITTITSNCINLLSENISSAKH